MKSLYLISVGGIVLLKMLLKFMFMLIIGIYRVWYDRL